MPYLVIIRHGQSEYNLQNRFTGQLDVPLTEYGKKEAKVAGHKLKKERLKFDNIFTSGLKRAHETLNIIEEELKLTKNQTHVVQSNALNERNYGELQGLNKTETAAKFSEEQVHAWRRGYASRPPGGESLADTYNRVIEYYKKSIELFDNRISNPKNANELISNRLNRAFVLILLGEEKKGKEELEKLKIENPDKLYLEDIIKMNKKEYFKNIFEE